MLKTSTITAPPIRAPSVEPGHGQQGQAAPQRQQDPLVGDALDRAIWMKSS